MKKKKSYVVILPNGTQIGVTAAKVEILASGDLYFSTGGEFEARFQIWAGYGIDGI